MVPRTQFEGSLDGTRNRPWKCGTPAYDVAGRTNAQRPWRFRWFRVSFGDFVYSIQRLASRCSSCSGVYRVARLNGNHIPKASSWNICLNHRHHSASTCLGLWDREIIVGVLIVRVLSWCLSRVVVFRRHPGTPRTFYALHMKRVENSGDGLQAGSVTERSIPMIMESSEQRQSSSAVYYIYLGVRLELQVRLECVRGNRVAEIFGSVASLTFCLSTSFVLRGRYRRTAASSECCCDRLELGHLVETHRPAKPCVRLM